jgi:hypothetical protein
MTSSKRLKYNFPWLDLPPYGGFFIPTLNPTKIRELGLKEGVRVRVIGKGTPCIYKGQIGVMFTVGGRKR